MNKSKKYKTKVYGNGFEQYGLIPTEHLDNYVTNPHTPEQEIFLIKLNFCVPTIFTFLVIVCSCITFAIIDLTF